MNVLENTIANLRECLDDSNYFVQVPYPIVVNAWDLLRKQEPRMMALDEALAADYVYLEIRLHPNLPCECCILAVERDGDILALKRGFGGYLDREEYGETWRCWTAPPTDAQREATPWK